MTLIKDIYLRFVKIEDAPFLYKLRTHETRSRYLNPVSGGVDGQVSWLKAYFVRHGNREDFYFIIESNKEKYGAIRLYNIDGNSFEWGSFIVLPESPPKTSVISLVTILSYAFHNLNLSFAIFLFVKTIRTQLNFTIVLARTGNLKMTKMFSMICLNQNLMIF